MQARKELSKSKYLFVFGIFAIVLTAMLALTACSSDGSSESSSDADSAYADLDPVTIILADSTSKDSVGNLWGQAISDKAKEITGGKLNVDYHGTGELGGDTDLIRQEQSNDIQMVICQPAPMVSFIPNVAVFDVPLAFANYNADQIDEVLNGDGEFASGIQGSFEEAGLHCLTWLQNATYRDTTANRDLSTLEDFQGLQIRTMENSNHMAFWEALGADPTPLAWSETYFALQNGTVDAQENSVDACTGASLQEVQSTLAMTKHMLYVNCLSINNDCWNSLDPAYQDALMQAINEATEEIKPQMTQIEEDDIQVMKDAGMNIVEYDQSFYDQLVNLPGVQQLYADISSQTGGLSDILISELQATQQS